jgi:hypothetical protein
MTDLFNRYREFMENVEKSMDRVIGSRSRGNEIRDAEAFRQFWEGVCSQPAMRCQWERRLADRGFERERDALLKLALQLTAEDSPSNVREAA